MKSFKLLFVLTSMACILSACETPQDLNLNNKANSADLKMQAKSSKVVKLPYKAKMHTSAADDAHTELCSFNSPTDFWSQDHQVGSGNATYLGNYTTDLIFCFHVVLNEQGQPDFEGGFGEFTGAISTIEANNGDQLFTKGKGSRIMPIQNENYVFEFEHTIEITGGTGRFEDASGEIVNYGMVRNDGTGTDHIQEGYIILK